MDGFRAQDPADHRIGAVAARQYGVISRGQLAAVGLSRGMIERRLAAGRLVAVHRGVYAVGVPLHTRHGRLLAAVLACGDGAAASHLSAAEVWRLLPGGAGAVHVTVPTRCGRRRRDGLVVHRASLGPDEVTERAGIPLTSPTRTLIDLADVVPRRALERAIDEAENLRLDCSGLAPRHGRPGAGLLERVLGEHRAGSTRTRSALEDRFLALCETHNLPRPQVNVHVEGYEVDFLWEEQRLIVETDGRGAHGTRRAFERDRLRDAHLTVAGYRIIRITHARLAAPAAVADQVRTLLAV